ncbi:hypothetical protein [Streptomyces sp. NPDC016172]|uniref:hypothetical protein n=1 Tax=Streptomyces sp. NPDC016172 TaxID=3364964 RepID=UPI0036FD3D1B
MSSVPALAACSPGGFDDGGSGDREARYQRVIEDPHPRPADVIEAAGAPTSVVRADDGSLLLTLDAGNVEDDEGPAASAWRIVDRHGRTAAEHAEHADAEAVRAAFRGVPGASCGCRRRARRAAHGRHHRDPVALPPRRHPARRTGAGPVHRPATRTVAPPAGVPDNAVRLAVDERGTAWSLAQSLTETPYRVVRQRDGRTLGSTAVPKPYAAGALTARGGTAALSLIQGDGVRGLLVTTDGGGHWRTVGAGIAWRELKHGPESLILESLADGRLLVGEEGGRYWLADDRTNSAFHELKTPATFTSFTVVGTTLYGIADATTATYDRVEGEGLWISRDGGREWRRHGQRGSRSGAEATGPGEPSA